MLYTFFFGYLQLKWRRLFRVLSLVALTIVPNIFYENFYKVGRGAPDYEVFFAGLVSVFTVVLLIGLISWVLKPFIIKE